MRATVDADGPKAIVLEDVSKAYPGVKALEEVSFSLKRHSVLGLVGENGAGKSTLLSIINGSVRPDSGTLSIDGHPVRFGHPTEAARHGVATVFQEQGLIGTIPVYENIFLGREHKFLGGAGWLRHRAMIAEAKAVLDDLHVDVDPRALTGSLSFGQRQLVEIAKAFALSRVYPVEPIILLDEPTSALSDQETLKLFEGIARWRTRASLRVRLASTCRHLRDLRRVCRPQGRPCRRSALDDRHRQVGAARTHRRPAKERRILSRGEPAQVDGGRSRYRRSGSQNPGNSRTSRSICGKARSSALPASLAPASRYSRRLSLARRRRRKERCGLAMRSCGQVRDATR